MCGYCVNCGKWVNGTKFCTHCGTKVPETTPAVKKSPEPVKSYKPPTTYKTQQQSTPTTFVKATNPKAEKPICSASRETSSYSPRQQQQTSYSKPSTFSSTKSACEKRDQQVRKEYKPSQPYRATNTEVEIQISKQSAKSAMTENLLPSFLSTGSSTHKKKEAKSTPLFSTSSSKKCHICKSHFEGGESYKVIFGKNYHERCMKCYKCGCRLYSTSDIYEHKHEMMCKTCMLKKQPKCGRCSNPIVGEYYKINGVPYHKECTPN
ncbi:hypothetical protein EIN_044260 [Entamoeba invadens IP1]|uniref:LIM zinc-binding domain-containing protein n=1 Tax=Entamoeba invadens IP1 TaxID=370355 RepID=A0A0A1U2K3_ENTIV|nr:hypothetical protein EIN_044260 [Entamoeba invadens IP1]ELP86868.1 hypothetical protein EIN_044260 [Entamoeba invadens IP1]|eukprot:XP_004253639.1 hypothetical protein EIN_044260 [Entamoeba invadens IP1]